MNTEQIIDTLTGLSSFERNELDALVDISPSDWIYKVATLNRKRIQREDREMEAFRAKYSLPATSSFLSNLSIRGDG